MRYFGAPDPAASTPRRLLLLVPSASTVTVARLDRSAHRALQTCTAPTTLAIPFSDTDKQKEILINKYHIVVTQIGVYP
jgi:hypothetical protein